MKPDELDEHAEVSEGLLLQQRLSVDLTFARSERPNMISYASIIIHMLHDINPSGGRVDVIHGYI